MCMGCWQYGYCCRDAAGTPNKACQRLHWNILGHRDECPQLQSTATATATP